MILSILDLNDDFYDTAVFADALRTSNESAATCVRGSQAIGPGLAITGPGPGFTSRTRFPTLTGTAGNTPGDDPNVTVRVFNGADTSGALVTTLAAPRNGASWSATPTTPIPAGTYTAQASQRGANGGTGVSPPVTFTIVQPGDRDHDGILDDEDSLDGSKPPVPGKSVVVRVVSGQVFIKFPAGQGPRAVVPPPGFVPLKGAANVPDRLAARHRQRPGRADLGSRHGRQEDPDGGLLRRPLPGQAVGAQEEAEEAEGADHGPGAQGSSRRGRSARRRRARGRRP